MVDRVSSSSIVISIDYYRIFNEEFFHLRRPIPTPRKRCALEHNVLRIASTHVFCRVGMGLRDLRLLLSNIM